MHKVTASVLPEHHQRVRHTCVELAAVQLDELVAAGTGTGLTGHQGIAEFGSGLRNGLGVHGCSTAGARYGVKWNETENPDRHTCVRCVGGYVYSIHRKPLRAGSQQWQGLVFWEETGHFPSFGGAERPVFSA